MVNNQNMTKRENNAIINSDMDKREFKITIGIRSYWITQEELNKYMAERVQPGVEYVSLRNGLMVLPIKFQDIVHRSVIEDSEKIEEGRWQCDKGNWHRVGGECRCDLQMIEGKDGIIRIQQKSTKPLLAPPDDELNMQTVSQYLYN